MESSDPGFNNFEEMFDNEADEDAPNMPDIEFDWKAKNDKCAMLSLEAGVIILSMDISQFIFSIEHKIKLHISYLVKGELEDSKLVINIGNLTISSESIYSNDLDIIQFKDESYKNLLALTSVSESINIRIFMRESLEKLIDFFKSLKFEVLNVENRQLTFLHTQHNLAMDRQYFLYCCHGYFNGVLIRLKALRRKKLAKVKVYVR